MKKIVVLASGRGTNFHAVIKACGKKEINAEIVALITNKMDARAIGRAKKNQIPIVIINGANLSRKEFNNALLEKCKELETDLIVLAGFMKILDPLFIRTFRNRIINIHPSLLPAYPGLDAQRKALEFGASFSGCTAHFVDEGVDTGPIIAQSTVSILENDTVEELSSRILEKEHPTLVRAVKLFCEDKLEVRDQKVYIK